MGIFHGHFTLAALKSAARRAVAASALLALGAGCAGSQGNQPKGDLVKMSKSEVGLAADLWQRLGQTREALDHALKAVEYDPKNPDAAHIAALLYLDFCRFSRIGECRLDEAERHARTSVALKPDFLEARNTLAVILIHRGKAQEAVDLLIPITQDMLYSTPEIAWGNLGWAYMELGDNKKAIPALRRAVAAQPLFCVGSFRLGVAYHRTGAMESAVEALNRAVETDAPGCEHMQDAYLERAQVHLALGEEQSTREDLDRCIDLSKTTRSGKKCNQLMAEID